MYANGVWAPRTYPLWGQYDGSGGVEKVQQDTQRDIWLEGLAYDTVPRGWGENTVRHVAVQKKMTWDQMLDAIYDRRLRVRSHVRDMTHVDLDRLMKRSDKLLARTSPEAAAIVAKVAETERKAKRSTNKALRAMDVLPKGVPTRVRVERALLAAGHPIYGRVEDKADGYIVAKCQQGLVRVRWQQWTRPAKTELDALAEAQKVIGDEYTTMICVSGQTERDVCMLVGAKPGVEGPWVTRLKKKSLLVQLAMIREDVWDALLTVPSYRTIESYYAAIAEYEAMTIKARAESRAILAKAKTAEEKVVAEIQAARVLSSEKFRFAMGLDPLGDIAGRDSLPFVVGLGTHWYLMQKRYLGAGIPEEFLRTAAEFMYIHSVLETARYYWKPSYPIGPQSGEWETHERVCKVIADVASANLNANPPIRSRRAAR